MYGTKRRKKGSSESEEIDLVDDSEDEAEFVDDFEDEDEDEYEEPDSPPQQPAVVVDTSQSRYAGGASHCFYSNCALPCSCRVPPAVTIV